MAFTLRKLTVLMARLTGAFNLANLDHTNCCQSLQDAGLRVYLPNTAEYSNQVDSYWSLTAQLSPYCFVQPQDTEQVSTAVKLLYRQPECKFAVRSGGHSSSAGANNIEDGITVDLGLLNATTYDNATGLASIQPGARWLDVYRTLDQLAIGVTGGRLGTVGVGGLSTGGGCSMHLYSEGLVCDNVKQFQVVLSNGNVVNASAHENMDLYKALKGGGNNFGIVTRFDMLTFPAKPIWQATKTHPEEEGNAHIPAFKRWVDNVEHYRHSSANVFWTYRPALQQTIVITAVADTLGKESPPIFDELLAIPGNISFTSDISNMSTIALNTQTAGYRNIWFSVTFKNDERIIAKAVELHHKLVEEMKRDSSDGDFETQCFFQPLPTIIGDYGTAKGGNILGIDSHEDNAMILLGSLGLNGVDQEAIGRKKMLAWKDQMEQFSMEVGGFIKYRYMNYADRSQDVISSYGDKNVREALEVAKRYDADAVFQRRVPGGFKLPDIEV